MNSPQKCIGGDVFANDFSDHSMVTAVRNRKLKVKLTMKKYRETKRKY